MDEHVLDELAAYLDDELPHAPRARVAAHLERCERCRNDLAAVRRGRQFVAALDTGAMPEPGARQLRETLLGQRSTAATPALSHPGALGDPGAIHLRPRRWRAVWAAALVAVAGSALAAYWQLNRPWIRLEWSDAAATPFEVDGQRLHEDLVAGDARIDYRSSDPRALWTWLQQQGAPTTTPVRTGADPARFVPVGAAVRTLAGARVSVLTYRVDGRPVTLALADRDTVHERPPAGWWSKRVRHRWSLDGRHSLTWTIGGGTYVMVADLDGDGLTACLICHDDARFVRRVSPPGPTRR